jgi:hypothetical protein
MQRSRLNAPAAVRSPCMLEFIFKEKNRTVYEREKESRSVALNFADEF